MSLEFCLSSRHNGIAAIRVSWVMSIKLIDLIGDGLRDILCTGKLGPGVGAWWLEDPGEKALAGPWKLHRLIPEALVLSGAMFLEVGDVDRYGLEDIVTTVDFPREGPNQPDHERRAILFLRGLDSTGEHWATHRIAVPPGTAQPKGVKVGDLDADGGNELVLTSTGAEGDLIGTYNLKWSKAPTDSRWTAHNIAGAPGIKYDVVHLVDFDGDGDLDALTNDEKEARRGLGVVWHENPFRRRTRRGFWRRLLAHDDRGIRRDAPIALTGDGLSVRDRQETQDGDRGVGSVRAKASGRRARVPTSSWLFPWPDLLRRFRAGSEPGRP